LIISWCQARTSFLSGFEAAAPDLEDVYFSALARQMPAELRAC
jgi:hypothetical protein